MRWRTAIAFVEIAGVCGLLGVMGISYLADRTAGERNLVASERSPALIARGKYLARLGDCAACHSVPGRPAFAGGLRMAIPIGAIYTTNITPDPVNGIGRFSLADFDRALRFGVADGHSLYPAMPFPSYANTKPEDVAALFAYFQYGVAHTGEIELMGDDIGGIAVHVAARIAALAEAGEVLTSSTVKDLVAGSGLRFADRGVQPLIRHVLPTIRVPTLVMHRTDDKWINVAGGRYRPKEDGRDPEARYTALPGCERRSCMAAK
jgi:pimeloyl-ACP methyl ester carboxylesterase